jgi:thioesterase domain-containing protein/aryl carrier-like protein
MSDPQARALALRQRVDRLSVAQRTALAGRLRQRQSTRPPARESATLIAHVVPRPGAVIPSPAELRDFLSERVPAFMVPAAFVVTDRLPVLPNGKVDRRELAGRGVPATLPASVTPAANPIEAQLMRIWDDLIDVREIGRDDNFFALGGHSLLLPRLIDRVQRDFGVTLSLGALFQSPTVSAMADMIARRDPVREWRSLVGIREQGTRPPLYMVHGLGGEIGYFYTVAEQLHHDQPVFGLQAPVEPFDDVEAMAAHYLAEVRRHQPHGPYLLGGYCVGGCVAYEMARRLVAEGESVRLLALIDTVMPAPRPLGKRLKRLASRPPREMFATIEAHARRLAKRMTAPSGNVTPNLHFYGVPEAFQATAARHYRAQLHYQPRPYTGDMWLFRTYNDAFESHFGWRPLVSGRLEVRTVPGRHADVLKPPHVIEIARQLATALDDALASRS